jgi:hypothetical protein
MALKAVRVLSLVFVALILGLTFAHVLEIPGKLRLAGPDWLTVQQNLYVGFGTVGAVVEVLAILLAWAVALMARDRRPALRWSLGAASCISAGLVAWALLVAPMNAALAGWTPETLPPDWRGYRNQWEAGHAIHFALFLLGFAALVIAILNDAPQRSAR